RQIQKTSRMPGLLAGEDIKQIHKSTNSFRVIRTRVVVNSASGVEVREPPSPTAAGGAWQPETPRTSPGTHDRTASGFDTRAGQSRWHPALDRASPERFRVAAALRPHREITTSKSTSA